MQLILHAIHCNSYEGLKLSRLRRIVYPEAILGYKIERRQALYSGGCGIIHWIVPINQSCLYGRYDHGMQDVQDPTFCLFWLATFTDVARYI